MDATFPLISGSGSEPEEIPRSLRYATPTPPTSHASAKLNRREMNISETSTDSAGSVEIATTEKVRVGAPSPLRMLPLMEHLLDPDSQASQAFVNIEARIKGVLLKRGVNYSMRFYQLSEPEDEPVDSDHTILISMQHREDWAGITNDVFNTGLDQETSRPTVVIGLVRPIHNTFQRMLQKT
ncbi:MAG: hypothetical protein M1814_005237 [Vezdaea aestivalis]|nr:MAG: hypothetical protein M1814_005237 [Vezdaea aestivalis]